MTLIEAFDSCLDRFILFSEIIRKAVKYFPCLENQTGQVDLLQVFFYLASPGLYIPHVRGVSLESDHHSKVDIFIEEL